MSNLKDVISQWTGGKKPITTVADGIVTFDMARIKELSNKFLGVAAGYTAPECAIAFMLANLVGLAPEVAKRYTEILGDRQ